MPVVRGLATNGRARVQSSGGVAFRHPDVDVVFMVSTRWGVDGIAAPFVPDAQAQLTALLESLQGLRPGVGCWKYGVVWYFQDLAVTNTGSSSLPYTTVSPTYAGMGDEADGQGFVAAAPAHPTFADGSSSSVGALTVSDDGIGALLGAIAALPLRSSARLVFVDAKGLVTSEDTQMHWSCSEFRSPHADNTTDQFQNAPSWNAAAATLKSQGARLYHNLWNWSAEAGSFNPATFKPQDFSLDTLSFDKSRPAGTTQAKICNATGGKNCDGQTLPGIFANCLLFVDQPYRVLTDPYRIVGLNYSATEH